jgi:hypothetical protein
MKPRILVTILLAIIAAYSGILLKTAKATTDPVVSVIPSTIDWSGKSIGETFSVEVSISSPDMPIWSGQIGIGYNPLVLECLSFEKGPAADPAWIWLLGTINNDQGYVTPSGWSAIAGQEPGWTGTDTFMTYTFRVKGAGSTALDLTVADNGLDKYYRTKLNGNVDKTITEITPITLNDGYFDNGQLPLPPPKHDVVITYIHCYQTSVYVGDPVSIEVGVENKGDFTEDFDVTLYADKGINVIFDEYVIGIVHVDQLKPKSSEALLFMWNTANVPTGSYWFSAKLSLSSGENIAQDSVFFRGAYLGGICARPNQYAYDLVGALLQIGASASATAVAVAAAIVIFRMLGSEHFLTSSPQRRHAKSTSAGREPFRELE